jgi:hypothetical protein
MNAVRKEQAGELSQISKAISLALGIHGTSMPFPFPFIHPFIH